MAALRSRIKLVTFDAYNTLFKPKGGLSAQYTQEALKHGIVVTKANVSLHFGLAYNKQLEKAPFYGRHQGMTTKQWWEELVYATFLGAGAEKKDLDQNFGSLFNVLFERFNSSEGYNTFPDVRNTLIRLKQDGFHMGIISNSDERLLSVIKSLDYDQYFDFVLPSCVAGYEKPDIEIFEAAMRLAHKQGIRPDEALHVGDDIEKDYKGARDAGWHAVLLQRCKLSYQDSAPPLIPDGPASFPQTIMSLHDLHSILTCDSLRKIPDDCSDEPSQQSSIRPAAAAQG